MRKRTRPMTIIGRVLYLSGRQAVSLLPMIELRQERCRPKFPAALYGRKAADRQNRCPVHRTSIECAVFCRTRCFRQGMQHFQNGKKLPIQNLPDLLHGCVFRAVKGLLNCGSMFAHTVGCKAFRRLRCSDQW